MRRHLHTVFLCHSSLDKGFVRFLAERLSNDGLSVWIDEAELRIGDSIIEKISEAIDQVEFVVAIISSYSVPSSCVQKELSLAMTKEIEGKKVVVLPAVIENCHLPASISDKLYADVTQRDRFEAEYKKLLRSIQGTDQQSQTSLLIKRETSIKN